MTHAGALRVKTIKGVKRTNRESERKGEINAPEKGGPRLWPLENALQARARLAVRPLPHANST